MKRVPEVIFVIDGEYESQAIKEANSLGLISFAVSNTNGDPMQTTDIIPANTNSVKSLEYLATALKVGFKAPAKKEAIKVQEQEKVSGAPKVSVKKTEAKKEEAPKAAAKPASEKEAPKTEEK